MSDYDRMARAIDYLVARAGEQPGLNELAAHVRLSPFHFQRLFARWVGLSPKRFLQVITVERAKRLLDQRRETVLAASAELGLSSSSRLQEHFIKLEAVTPGEYRRRGEELLIRCGESDTPFGRAFVATTARGVCAVAFLDQTPAAAARAALATQWPGARLTIDDAEARAQAARMFAAARERAGPVSLSVRGTNFQVAVWRALLEIPSGALVAYGDIARRIGRPRAVRAVGTAVGANPCAFVIPCHRVIRESGAIGGYRWGLTRKHAMHVWEAARSDGMLAE